MARHEVVRCQAPFTVVAERFVNVHRNCSPTLNRRKSTTPSCTEIDKTKNARRSVRSANSGTRIDKSQLGERRRVRCARELEVRVFTDTVPSRRLQPCATRLESARHPASSNHDSQLCDQGLFAFSGSHPRCTKGLKLTPVRPTSGSNEDWKTISERGRIRAV